MEFKREGAGATVIALGVLAFVIVMTFIIVGLLKGGHHPANQPPKAQSRLFQTGPVLAKSALERNQSWLVEHLI